MSYLYFNYLCLAQCSQEGFKYVVGYVQRKVKKKFPGLDLPEGVHHDAGWIEHLSRGGLTVPNNNLVSLCKKLGSQFSLFHGDNIDMEPEPIERLLNVILSELPRDHETVYICTLFVKVRFFNRIKLLNVQIKTAESSEKVRAMKQTAQHAL